MNPRTSLVLDEFARHRRQFTVLCESLTEDELSTAIPGSHWTVKDYIAHLCTIDGLIVPGFARLTGVSAPASDIPVPAPFDIDEWNDAAILARRGVPVTTLLEEAAQHRERLESSIAAMTDAHLDAIIPYGGDRKSLGLQPTQVRFGGLLWGIAIHDPTHTRDILRALPARQDEPWISEWLSSVNDSMVPQGVRDQRV